MQMAVMSVSPPAPGAGTSDYRVSADLSRFVPKDRADAEKAKEPTVPAELTKAVEQALNALLPEAMPSKNAQLQVAVDPETKDFIYKTVDSKSGEVIRQWPSEQILGLFKVMRELAGLTVDGKA